jgi:hypothetical protein
MDTKSSTYLEKYGDSVFDLISGETGLVTRQQKCSVIKARYLTCERILRDLLDGEVSMPTIDLMDWYYIELGRRGSEKRRSDIIEETSKPKEPVLRQLNMTHPDDWRWSEMTKKLWGQYHQELEAINPGETKVISLPDFHAAETFRGMMPTFAKRLKWGMNNGHQPYFTNVRENTVSVYRAIIS